MAELPQPAPPPLPPAHPPNPWARAALWLGIVLIVVGGAAYCFKRFLEVPERLGDKAIQVVEKVDKFVEKTGQRLLKVVEGFNREDVSTTFVSYAVGLSNQTCLQFATLKGMEIFTRTPAYSTFFGHVRLPEVVVEARLPVQCTYYLDLNAPWRFVLGSNLVYVLTPSISNNAPAVDVSAMTFELRKGALNFRHKDVEERLRQDITGLLAMRARENVPLVRETARRQTEQFVERWLAQSFTDGKQYTVKVLFPGEPPPGQTKIAPRPLN